MEKFEVWGTLTIPVVLNEKAADDEKALIQAIQKLNCANIRKIEMVIHTTKGESFEVDSTDHQIVWERVFGEDEA